MSAVFVVAAAALVAGLVTALDGPPTKPRPAAGRLATRSLPLVKAAEQCAGRTLGTIPPSDMKMVRSGVIGEVTWSFWTTVLPEAPPAFALMTQQGPKTSCVHGGGGREGSATAWYAIPVTQVGVNNTVIIAAGVIVDAPSASVDVSVNYRAIHLHLATVKGEGATFVFGMAPGPPCSSAPSRINYSVSVRAGTRDLGGGGGEFLASANDDSCLGV